MTETNSTITARAMVAGIHHWPKAPSRRNYLQYPHRHQFHISATVVMAHDDRDVEFHDLAELLWATLKSQGEPYHGETELVNFGAQSCEVLAREVLEVLTSQGLAVMSVTVSEDNENDGTVYGVAQP